MRLVVGPMDTPVQTLSKIGSLHVFNSPKRVLFGSMSIGILDCNDCVMMKFSGIFPHDAVSFVALVRPDLFTYKRGVVRVETQGICLGHTLLDQGLKM